MVREVRSPATSIIVIFTLAICLICPLVEMFDQWDHSLQTGSDTEYALVILALCVGVAYWFAWFVSKISPPDFPAEERYESPASQCFSTPLGLHSIIPLSISPPVLALRI
jgi:hypothetical protein